MIKAWKKALVDQTAEHTYDKDSYQAKSMYLLTLTLFLL